MIVILSIFSFLLGAVLASFGGVLIDRIPNKQSIVKPASHCPNCNNYLKWYDNIPILSFLILKGKCRYCGQKIGLFYFLLEVLGGVSFLLVFLRFGINYNTIIGFGIAFLFLVIGGIDYKTHYIYDLSLIVFLVLSLVSYIVPQCLNLEFNPAGLIGLAVGFLFFLLVKILARVIAKQEALGMGDVFLLGIAGLLLGWQSLILAILIASVCGAIIEVSLIALKKKNRESEIAFGPYLVLGIFIAYLYGQLIIDWYLGMVI